MITNKPINPVEDLSKELASALKIHFNITETTPTLIDTPSHQKGSHTLILYPYMKDDRGRMAGQALQKWLEKHSQWVARAELVGGFLNMSLNNRFWITHCQQTIAACFEPIQPEKKQVIAAEIACPNTNKPLHLGHLRNGFLGAALARLFAWKGHQVVRMRHINDRGIHIAQSMVGFRRFGGGKTPQSEGIKGDHFVGQYYVLFHKKYTQEVASLVAKGLTEKEAKQKAPIMQEAQQLLRDWEAGIPAVMALWKQMNQWVYDGFDDTFKRMGAVFDQTYYESALYLRGKSIVQKGLEKGVFFSKPNGSIWIDLKDKGLDEKLLLRADGSTVYMTQDLGTADARYEDYPFDKMLYVVGNEQNYHFNVLFEILKRLKRPYANQMEHVSYGMVELPDGKMKSREGTVVDADDLMEQMFQHAKERTNSLAEEKGGPILSWTADQKQQLYEIIGQGALIYYLLKVHPKKRMLFNPSNSIDWQGDSCACIQYTYARIQSICNKAKAAGFLIDKPLERWSDFFNLPVSSVERQLLQALSNTNHCLEDALNSRNISLLAQQLYGVAKVFNHFYAEAPILRENRNDLRTFRIALTQQTARIMDLLASLLGIQLPETM